MKRHAVWIYFALVFIISWGGGLLIVGPGGLPLNAAEFANGGALLYAATLAGPSLAGLLLIAVCDGRPGLHDLVYRLRHWRVGSRWYAFALLPALAMVAVALLLSLVSADLRPALFDSRNPIGTLTRALGPALLVGALEEIGWSGYATPRLRARYSVMATGLTIGVVWGAWHFPLFWESNSFAGSLLLAILLARLFAWLPPFRVLLVWVYDHTRSLPVVMLMHAAVSFVSIAFASEGLTGVRLLASPLAAAATMWLFLGLFGLASREPLVRPPLHAHAR